MISPRVPQVNSSYTLRLFPIYDSNMIVYSLHTPTYPSFQLSAVNELLSNGDLIRDAHQTQTPVINIAQLKSEKPPIASVEEINTTSNSLPITKKTSTTPKQRKLKCAERKPKDENANKSPKYFLFCKYFD